MNNEHQNIKHRISYNIPEDTTLEEFYRNADELKAVLPKEELTNYEVNAFMQGIKPTMWYQFNIASYDYDNIGEDGLPELIFIGHLQEWIYG